MPPPTEDAHPGGAPRPRGPAHRRIAFSDVDADDRARLVAMMDATDAWPAVQAARSWALVHTGVGPGDVVVDVGAGPGTFGAAARAAGGRTLDIDRSDAMVREVRTRHGRAPVARAALPHLPVRTGAATVVHAERVLQWTDDPTTGLAELWRLVAPGGHLVVTDTDWGTFAVDHPDPAAAERLASAALRWVPQPTLAASLDRALDRLGATEVAIRTDAVHIDRWDPRDPDQHDGPPGLPLRMIAAAGPATSHDVDAIAAQAQRDRFTASLTLVTAAARRPTATD